MDLSLARLKKVLKFGILLTGIQLSGLQSGLGEYTPSSLKGFTSNAIDNGDFCYSFWMQPLAEEYYYKSTALIRQAVVPSAMVDSNGDLYTVSLADLSSPKGIKFMIKKHIPSELMDNYSKTTLRGASKYVDLYPWEGANKSINCQTTPNLTSLAQDPTYFKNYIHNAFQPCITQEVGKHSDYLYMFFYIPPLRFMNPSNSIDNEGILMVKIDKSSMSSVVSKTLYSGGQNNNNYFSFNHQRPRRDSDSSAFGTECGNYQAWVDTENTENTEDTEDSSTDHVHLNWIALEKANDFSTSRTYQLYNNDEVKMLSVSLAGHAGGRGLESRAIKYNGNIYTGYVDKGRFLICKYSPTASDCKSALSWSGGESTPFGFIDHSSGTYNSHTARNYDFCIVDNKTENNSPIFCVLGLRPTSETDSITTSLSGATNNRWNSPYINDTSKIVLILSSYAWNGETTTWVERKNAAEDPQNIIYSTGKTTEDSCPVDCVHSSNTNDDYGENQLFKNTHKLCTYTSDLGGKFIIYCYCYPGKTKQLFLGYARYYIANNKIHLLTKTEFKSPPTTNNSMEESFSNFTSCSRIISMDCKNGQLWITWMNADNTVYYYFHIAAKDLVGE